MSAREAALAISAGLSGPNRCAGRLDNPRGRASILGRGALFRHFFALGAPGRRKSGKGVALAPVRSASPRARKDSSPMKLPIPAFLTSPFPVAAIAAVVAVVPVLSGCAGEDAEAGGEAAYPPVGYTPPGDA